MSANRSGDRLDCREAQVRSAARRVNELDMVGQRELEEHLRGCAACRASDHAVGTMADLLRRGTPTLDNITEQRVWQRVAQAQSVPAPSRRFAALPWVGAAVAAAAVLLLSLWLNRGPTDEHTARTRSATANAATKRSAAARTAVAATRAAQVPRRFRLLAYAGARIEGAAGTHRLGAGARLVVSPGGGALLASRDALVWLESGSRLRVGARGATLHLELGRVHVRTRRDVLAARASAGTKAELAVVVHTRAGLWRARPVGTQYSVARDSQGRAQVAVYVGRVAIGRVAIGRAAIGRAAIGRAAIGRAAIGRAAIGRAAIGRAAIGRAAQVRAGETLGDDGTRGVAPTRRPPLERLEALASAAGGRRGATSVQAPARCVRVAGIALACGHATLHLGVDAGALRQLDTREGRLVTAVASASAKTLAKTTKRSTAPSRLAVAPARKAVAAKPVAAKPVAAKPVAAKPVAAKPVAAKSVAAKPVAAKPVVGATTACTSRPLERLLASGDTANARKLATERKARCGAAKAALFATIVAESLAREKRHAEAGAAYLALYLVHSRSALGMSALYNAASIELLSRKRATAAVKLFALYIRRYPRGAQCEDAYYMLWRAQLAAQHVPAARAVVRRYRARYPRGRYLGRMR